MLKYPPYMATTWVRHGCSIASYQSLGFMRSRKSRLTAEAASDYSGRPICRNWGGGRHVMTGPVAASEDPHRLFGVGRRLDCPLARPYGPPFRRPVLQRFRLANAAQ